MFFELLQAKPYRIMYKFRQKPNFETTTCKIRTKVGNGTCPDLPRPVQEDKYLPQTSGSIFIFFRLYTFHSLLAGRTDAVNREFVYIDFDDERFPSCRRSLLEP